MLPLRLAGSVPTDHAPWGSRSAIGAMVHALNDIQGNRDGLWRNEHLESDVLHRSARAGVARQARQAAWSTGLSTDNEQATLTAFLQTSERHWEAPVTELDPTHMVAGMHFVVSKALMLTRLGRHPSTVRDTYVRSEGSMLGTSLPAREVRVRCFAPTALANDRCVVLVPSPFLPTSASLDTIQAWNARGCAVVTLEHEHHESDADTGSPGLRQMVDVAAVLAAVQARYGAARVHAVGCSAGATVGVLGTLLFATSNQIDIQGPPLDPSIPAVLVSPWVGTDRDLARASPTEDAPLDAERPPTAAVRPTLLAGIAGDPTLQAHATQQALLSDLRIRRKHLESLTPTLSHIVSHIADAHRPAGPVHILHAAQDPFSEPTLVRSLAHATGAHLHWTDAHTHLLELHPHTPDRLADLVTPATEPPSPTPIPEHAHPLHGAARDRSLRGFVLATRSAAGQSILPDDAADHMYLFVPGVFTERYPFYLRDPLARLSALGLDHVVVPIDTDQAIARNVEPIRETILEYARDGRQVVLVGHSKGGVDIAAALSFHPELRPLVRAMVALQTPWLGSPIADFVAGRSTLAQGHRLVVERAFQGDEQALLDLQESVRHAFVAQHPWPTEVPTVSLATALTSRKRSLLSLVDGLLSDKHGPTDGFVPVSSAILPGSDAVFARDIDHGGIVLPAPAGLSAWLPPADLVVALIALALERAAELDPRA